jgi:lambda family phage portal protein
MQANTQRRTLLSRITFGLLGTRSAPPRTGARAFHAARLDRFSADWMATANSINQELRSDLDRLRARGRDLTNNNDYGRKFVGMCQNNIIGPGGVRYQARVVDGPGKPDELANDALESAWDDWQTVADVTGRQHFRDMCETMVGGLPSDGEFLLRHVRGAEAGNRFNYGLQLIDVDRIDTAYNVAGANGRNAIVMGVEVNTWRRPVALHLFQAHPNDGQHASRERVRVPMEDIIHAFKVDRAGQLRGIPWMAPGMLSLHHLGGFMLSAVMAAEHGANHYGFFKTPDGAPPIGGEDSETGQQIATTVPGTFDTLPAGVEHMPFNSAYPNEVFGPFVKTALQRVATGWRVAYVSLANDLEGVNYSSIRQGVIEERDRWTSDQEWFTATVMEPVFREWLRLALLSGAIIMPNGSKLPAAKLQKFSAHEWQARRWEWVDPKGDIEAKILMVKAGLMSPQDLAAAMGYDFLDTVKAIAMAKDIAARYGVSLPAYDAAPGAVPSAGQPAAQPTEPAKAGA